MDSLSISGIVVGLVIGLIIGRVVGRRGGGVAEQTKAEREELLSEARDAVSTRIARRKDRIVATARKEEGITNDGVEDLFCISDTTARRYLRELEEERRLVREGTAGGTRYVPVDEVVN